MALIDRSHSVIVFQVISIVEDLIYRCLGSRRIGGSYGLRTIELEQMF